MVVYNFVAHLSANELISFGITSKDKGKRPAGDSSKGTTVREALKQWEEATRPGAQHSEALEVKLIGLYPPIEKLDSSLQALEVLAETLEQLWISYNLIEKMKGVGVLKKLKVLYMSNNLVKDWVEFIKLTELTALEELNFVGNPLEEKHTAEGTWRTEVERKLTGLKKLDGLPIIREMDDEAIIEQQQEQQQQQQQQQQSERKDSTRPPTPS
ncbi:LOW QUALITY PROTEIN: dynein axonemal light chain 1-like [Penaeus chinensis]|uniref:LOW QUALITY PROTEIN: dynein axonemal light chain 1-like n=1 Tax=Penaeus chinensis TaxID=139456 RepID=UPI001FB6678E|nr:LOW QUALITY PROTEIN: dynein axonemal light chain 1-like [Penaeus chinensis]